MSDRRIEQILAEVGGYIAKLGMAGSERYFLYLETEQVMQSPYLFQEFDNRVNDVSPSGIGGLLYDLWLGAKPQRWGALRYELDGTVFSATFDYDVDAIDGGTDNRAQMEIKARFGDKPIVYLSHEEWEQGQLRHINMLG